MKKIYLLLCLIFSLTFILPIFTGCDWDEYKPESYIRYLVDEEDGMKIPEFHTNLTNEEHLKNIQELAEKRYSWASRIYVDLLYNYKDAPQFFLVEYDCSAIAGTIIDDNYYIKETVWQPNNMYLISPLNEVNAYDCKKYLMPVVGENCYDKVFFERDDKYHNFERNYSYVIGEEQGVIEINSLTKEAFNSAITEAYTNDVMWASAKVDLKEVEYKGKTYQLSPRLRYGYAETVNDLIKL